MTPFAPQKAKLKLGVSTLAISVALLASPGASFAQTPGGEASTVVDEVVVTGIRGALRNSAAVKRNSVQVLDAITAEDIGDFPDKNIGEALQRVTGVQITRQDGEGRGVSIRGADPSLNRIEINGTSALSLTVGGGDRAVDFRDIPVEFVSRLEVVKSPTADMVEGGIGGTVRVITRRPFDARGSFVAGSVQGIYSTLAEAYDPKVALIGSTRLLDDTLGVLLSGTWETRNLHSHNARTTGWIRRAATATGLGATPGRSTDVNMDGTLDWVPEIPRPIIDRRETDRLALNGIIEWRPTDSFKMYADATYATATESVNSSLLQLSAAGGLIDYTKSTVGEDNTVNHIELTSSADFPMDLAYRNILGELERTQYTTAVGGEWTVGKFKLDARVDYSNAEVQNDEINSTAVVFEVPRAVIDYTGSQRAPNVSFPGLDVTTGQGVNRIDATFNPRNNTSEETGLRFNVEYRPESGIITAFKAGLSHRDFETTQVLYQRTTRLSCRTTPLGAAIDTSSAATVVVQAPCATLRSIVDNNSVTNEIPFFATGDVGYAGGIRFWNDNTYATYAATLAAAGRNDDVFEVNPNPNTAQTAGGQGSYQNFLDTWGVSEKTTSAYVQANYNITDWPWPTTGTVGVRVVETETLSTGFNRTTGPGGGAPVNFTQGSQAGGYTKVLPSFNMRMELIPDKLIYRFAAAEVLARAAPSQLALRRSTDIVGLTGSRGNPGLQPFQATQFDAGLEWYFTPDSFVSATVFHKEISSFIRTSAPTPEVIDGVTYNITSPINGTDRVKITGLEAGVQYSLDFLPAPFNGLGVLANVTIQESEGYNQTNAFTGETLTFPGLSPLSYNLSAYYEDEKFSARLSYNWRDLWLITPTGRGNLPEFNEAFGSLDASASYNINDNFTVFVEGVNLTDEVRIEHNSPARRIGNETFGSRYFFGIRARF